MMSRVLCYVVVMAISVCGQRVLKCSGNQNRPSFLNEWLLDYNRSIAPAETVNVTVKFWVILMSEVSVLGGYAVFSTRLDQTWNDSRLRYRCQNESAIGYIWSESELDRIWNPDVSIIGLMAKGVAVKENYLSTLDPAEGTVRKSVFSIIRIPCYPNVRKFPFDKLIIGFRVSTKRATVNYQTLHWDTRPIELYPKSTKNPSWYSTSVDVLPNRVFLRAGRYPTELLAIEVLLARYTAFYIFQCYIPPFCVVLLGGFSFFMNPESMTGRVGFTTTAVLALFFQYGTIVKQLPKVGYIKGIDVWLIGCLLFLMFALTQYCILAFIMHYMKKKVELSLLKRIDAICASVYVIGFIVFVVVYCHLYT